MRSFFTTLAAIATLALGFCLPAMADGIGHIHAPTCLHHHEEISTGIGFTETVPIFVLSEQVTDSGVKFHQSLTAKLTPPRAHPSEWQAMQRIADVTFLTTEPRAPDKAARL